MHERKIIKIIVIGLVILLFGAAITLPTSSKNIKLEIKKNTLPLGRSWSDNFDTYTTGQFLDGGPDDGGWKGWDNDPTFGAYVVDDEYISSPNAVEIAGDSDLIHEYTGYTAGLWTYIAWVFVPNDFSGNSYFMLLSNYEDLGTNNKWQFVVRFDSASQIVESENDGNYLPLITDQWVEIRVEINLDTDWFELYYDNDLLIDREWTAGWNGAGDGYLVIDAIDLYAEGSTAIYYDDMSLTGDVLIPEVGCQGNLNWEDVEPGGTVTGEFEVANIGDEGSILDWEIAESPEWGEWTFTPNNGTGLTPDDGWITIELEVVAPEETEKEFTGEIRIINSNNPDDYCEIDVILKTPTIYSYQFPLLQKILQRFPILKQLLGI